MDKPQGQKSPTALQQTLGEKVMMLRKRKKITQTQLATMTGNSANTIRRLERGDGAEMAVGRLRAIAQALDVPMGYFFDEVTV